MDDTGSFMDDPALCVKNKGAYSSPFSGVGHEYYGLGILPDHSGIVLHETGCLACNDGWNFPRVMSPFWRLYHNQSPGHQVLFAKRKIELTPDRLVLIPDHQFFHCQSSAPALTLWLHFNVARRLAPSQSIPVVLTPSRTEIDLIHSITQFFENDGKNRTHERIFHASLALLHVVLNRGEIQWQPPAPEAVTRTVRHIEEHYASSLSVGQLSKLIHLCPEALERSFKKHRGETLWRFLMKVRVREAAYLLLHSDATLEDIAQKTGFHDRGHLSRVFKKITGDSPALFRRMHTRVV
jgi:AraC-like DNA-binding protein